MYYNPNANNQLMGGNPYGPQQYAQATTMSNMAGGSGGPSTLRDMPVLLSLFRKAVMEVATRYLKHTSPSELLKMKKLFSDWKNEPDKVNVNNMYRLSGWRAIYTQSLFMSRIQTVDYSMKQLLEHRTACEVLQQAHRFVSLGCGPGPCIAGVITVIRHDLGVRHSISFIGVDQFIGWSPYINSLDNVSQHARVAFRHMRVEESTVDDLPLGDVCIMSYTDASIHTPPFWAGVQARYALIVILDQNKSALHGMLLKQGFQAVNYILKGAKKFYFLVGHKKLGTPVLKTHLRPAVKSVPTTPRVPPTKTEPLAIVAKTPDPLPPTPKPATPPPPEPAPELSLAQLSELHEVEICMEEDAVIKTKAGTGSGKYVNALEPRKCLSKERLNQLLRAKLLAIGEDLSEEESKCSTVSSQNEEEENGSNSLMDESEPAEEEDIWETFEDESPGNLGSSIPVLSRKPPAPVNPNPIRRIPPSTVNPNPIRRIPSFTANANPIRRIPPTTMNANPIRPIRPSLPNRVFPQKKQAVPRRSMPPQRPVAPQRPPISSFTAPPVVTSSSYDLRQILSSKRMNQAVPANTSQLSINVPQAPPFMPSAPQFMASPSPFMPAAPQYIPLTNQQTGYYQQAPVYPGYPSMGTGVVPSPMMPMYPPPASMYQPVASSAGIASYWDISVVSSASVVAYGDVAQEVMDQWAQRFSGPTGTGNKKAQENEVWIPYSEANSGVKRSAEGKERSPSPKRSHVAGRQRSRTPSPKRSRISERRSPSPKKSRIAERRSPSPKRSRIAERRSPSPKMSRIAERRSPSPKRSCVVERRSPSPKRSRIVERRSPSPKRFHIDRREKSRSPMLQRSRIDRREKSRSPLVQRSRIDRREKSRSPSVQRSRIDRREKSRSPSPKRTVIQPISFISRISKSPSPTTTRRLKSSASIRRIQSVVQSVVAFNKAVEPTQDPHLPKSVDLRTVLETRKKSR